MYKILIVEDDFTIAHSMSSHLEKWDFDTKCIEDFHDVLETFQGYAPDLVLMDVTLPCYNGFHWCSEIRKISNVPIIFVSSISDNMNIVMAINMGGDEYIEKPFDINVLTAKIQALLRRTYGLAQKKDTLDYRDLSLNLNSSNLCCNGLEISLSKNEYLILKLLNCFLLLIPILVFVFWIRKYLKMCCIVNIVCMMWLLKMNLSVHISIQLL